MWLCSGSSDRMSEFESANRHRVAFTATSGGLFVGERAKAISSYPHIPEANQRIMTYRYLFGAPVWRFYAKADVEPGSTPLSRHSPCYATFCAQRTAFCAFQTFASDMARSLSGRKPPVATRSR
ncbi:thioredoxin [Azoarcus sp. KH32C]|nr:thioredoxin [Azoarcus sp. KH32C]